MKKRILSILLALVMLVGMFPVQAFASERSYVYVSFEVCDADGSGRTLIKPERNERVQYTNDYALAAMRQAIGSNSDVKYDSDHLCITGVKDASQSDGFLDNGDIEGYRWIVLRNNAEWDGTDYNTMYKLGDNEVLRCIYTDKSVEEMSAVNKDAFVRYLSEVGESMWYESSAGYAEYMAALNVLVNSAATNADVQNATNALVAALTVSATVVEINQGEEMELGVHKSATLKATVTPSNTTDTMVWSSVDDSIVSVNATTGEITGVAEGETNVTVTVGAASDTIKIIVKPIAATAVSIKNGEAISLEARASVQLEAELTPAGATDTVSWCVADQSIATVDENGLLTGKTVGQTTVTATAGNVSDTIKVTVTETTVPYVYFEYEDGRIQELENDTFTLTALDEGSFKVGNFSSKLTWKCSDSITNNYNETEWRYWINTEGKYQPHGIKKIAATVTGNGFSKTFYINEVSSGISEIKVSVNGTEVDAQNPYSVTGMTTSVISVQGLKDGQWIYIPTQAWMAESGNTNVARILGNQMEIIDEGQSDVTVAMVDNEEAATSFSVVCNQVPVTGIEVHVPASFVIEKWDSMDGGYVGIIFGYEKPASEYYITFTPSNATNRNVIWTNLTPEIAEFHELHGAGIVPKKAGTAKFRVTSESNPDVHQDVEIVFSFKTPLTNAVIAEKSYALEEGQTVDLDITVTPDNATEPRFIWTYSKEGIVKVTETVSADTYTRTVTRRLNCLRTGSVTVTGTPIDDSANCPPIQFTVVVGDASGEDTTDYLQIAKNDIAHGKAYLSGQNQTYFNNEWTIFTYLRTGGTMDAQKKIAYLQNVQDEIANYGDSLETLDYTRLILTLPLLGENPANFADKYDLVEALCNSFSDNQTSNMYAYGLLTLDSMAYEMPADSAWSRDALIEKILTFQASDGSFGLGNNSSGSVDMTAIVLQALAPYNNANHPAVQAAITKALSYLKENLSANAGFEAEGGENACSSAQVLIALTALGIDPSDKDSGFTIGKSNLITNLDGFKLESGGFYWLEGNETVNLMGTQQITYAMEAYRRFVLDLNPLYDLTDLNESGSSTFTVTLPEGEGFDAKICDGFASTVAKGGDFSFYIVIESGYERSNMVVKAGNTILTADSYGVYTIKNIKSDVQITVSGVQKLDYTNLLSAAIGADALDVAYIGLKTYKTGNGTEYQNIPFYTVKLPVESALTLTYNSTNPRAVLWMNYDNRFKENSGTYTFSSELLAGMYAMSSEKFVEAFGSDTGLNTDHTVAFIEVTTMGYNRLCCVLVELVPAESEEPEIPLAITVNGEAVEVTSIGDRTYSNAFGWGPYTLPFFTVKVPANTEFTITAEGAVNFACYDGYSLDGSSPFTVPVDSIQNIGGSGVGFGMSTEKFVELFGSDTGLNTENKLAFIEIKDDNYDRMYGLLVELEGSVEPEDPENPEDPDITIPITAELLDGTALTVTVNGTQSVNGNDVPVLEIAIPVGTAYVKVIPGGNYRVYDDVGSWEENADELSVIPMFGDFYTLTADGGRTIDYVIKFAEAKEEPPVVTVPITVTVNGEAVEVTSLGEREYLSSSWKDPYTKPIYTVKIQEGADFVINQTGAGDGASGNSRVFAMADGQSLDGNYPYTMTASYLNNYYLLSAEEFVERVGNDTGLDITQKLAFIEVKDSFYERIYVLLVELIPAEPEPVKYQVNLTEGAGFTLRAAAGSASPVEPGSSFSFTISINESFEKTTDFAVKANGVKLEEVDGKYTISNIQDDQTVTVEGVVGKATTDTLTVTANGESCNVVNTGLTSYKQSIYGTITDVPVYKTSVPVNTDFIVNWKLDKDGDRYSSSQRYAFSIDAGGDQGAKYYPFTMRTSVFGDYMLSAAQVKEFFGLDISSANALFMEVYGSEHSEGDFNPLYGLLVELVVPKTTYTVNFALLGDHKHAETEEEIHTLIDNNLEVWVAAKDYEVEPGATILDVLNMVAAENNLTVGNPNGDYVKYITKDGIRLSEFTNGARSGWMYTINGNHSGLGVAEQKLADGDVIIFHYTDDYTREKSSPADLEAAAAVVAKINAIGTVSLESKAKIEEARAAYDALSDEQRDLIGADVLKKLTDAEETYVELEKNAVDKAAAEAVEDKISAIGTVTMDSKAAIDEARAAYEELSDTQKNLVSNYQLLSQAEAAYAELVKTAADEAAAKVVDDKINAIGTVTLDSEKKIVEAREAYDALTDVQKALVTNREKLFAAEKKLVELKDQDAADAVEAKIAAIGTVTLNSEAKIKAAREAYNALTDTQKALVENLAILEAAEEALELLNLAGTDITNIYKTTGDYLAGLSAPVVGSTNGEWRVIGLTRAGRAVADSYYGTVVAYVKNNIDANGRLDESKSTENARVILALTAIGKDVTNVGGYNLLKGLNDMTYISKQGINGLMWTLIAFDSHDYEIPAGDVTREKLVQVILDAQVAGGGWALNGNVGDPDMTGMALQALSPYYGKNTAVTAAVDKALTWLSGIRNKNGSFSGNEGTTSESLAQVITGLTALGINPETDSRFIKNGVSTVDALSKFYVDGGGFKHDLTSGQNMMATEQGYYALVSYYRLLQGKTSLFDMSDVLIQTAAKDQEAADAVEVLINAIGTVTKDSGDKIKAARNAYDALTDAQKALVENYKILTAAEAKYAELVKTAEDEAVAKAVEDKIDAIGTVTLSSENKIRETRTTYDKLTAVQKALVGNYDKLTAAEQKLLELKDEAVANEVEKLINAIGTVTKDSGDKIKAARDAYDVLTENQKKLVENYKTLTDAESKFADLNSTISVTFTLLGCSKHGTDQVHTLADGNLSTWIAKKTYMVAPGATVKDVLQMALTAAGMNYKNPTGNYVESINGIGEFTNGSNSGWMYTLNGVHSSLGIAEQTVKEGDVIVFHYTDDYTKEKGGTATDEDTAIENVEALINAIGTVTLNSKSKIDTARKAYDDLTYPQKQKVENYKKLTDAEAKYTQLKADDDEKKANTVEDLIDAIISGSSTFVKDVKAAQKAYNNLTADQKKLVDNYYKLANYLKDLADEEDKEAAKTVEALIDAIGAVTKDSEDEIKSARTAYDKLTDTQKALVNNYAELEDAEARWEDLQALVDVENIYKDTGAYLKRLGTPVPGSVGGEWMAIGLIRSGNEIKDPAAYYDAIVKFIQENIDENGRLHKAKSTENSRMILALTALGKDATAVGGYNLLAGLNDMEYVQKQGINGPIWALIALDSGNYPAPEGDVSREALIQVILDAQLADGGWALTGSISDADITGMALQALARYYKTNADVTEAVDKAIATLSMMQAADGSFASVDGGSSESVAQVIAALSALGIDADTDTRFIKNGVSALDALCAFFVEDGGFKHIHDGKLDGMATEQSYYALVAYFRMLEGKTALFDMTDVVDMGGDQVEKEPAETLPAPTEPVEIPAEEGRSFPWWLVIVIGVLAGAIVVLVIISKPKKGRHMK